MKKWWDKFTHSCRFRKAMGITNKGVHALYFGAVAIEAHGNYAYAALGLLILLGANIFIHFED